MAGYPPPYPPPPGTPQGSPPRPPYGDPYRNDYKYQRRMMRDQAQAPSARLFKAQRRGLSGDQYRGMRRGSIVGPDPRHHHRCPLSTRPDHTSFRPTGFGIGSATTGRSCSSASGTVSPHRVGRRPVRPSKARNSPYFRRSVGGGVVALIIVMVVLGSRLRGHPRRRTPASSPTTSTSTRKISTSSWATSTRTIRLIAQAFPAQGIA